MKPEELEAKFKTLENKSKKLLKKVKTLQDIEEIKKLQKIYGYYIEHWQGEEIVALFSDEPDTSVELGIGFFGGKESIRRIFCRFGKSAPPEFLHAFPQLSGVVHIDRGGRTAKGRWYGFGLLVIFVGGKPTAIVSNGIYENEYIKEGGKWKFKKLKFYLTIHSPFKEGWVKSPLPPGWPANATTRGDLPSTTLKPYPSGYIVPTHFKHPITGK
jgi:hypothetical protein